MKKVVIPSATLGTLLLVVVFLSGCSGSSGIPQGTQPEKINTDISTTEESKIEAQVFKLGETIRLGDYVVSVSKMEDPYKAQNQYTQPDSGNRFVAVEVVYENGTTDKSLDYNPFDWKLFDSEGYGFESSFMADKEPRLSSGTLNPSGKVRGWLTFEVPQESKDFKLQFTPNFWDNDNVEILLY